jgi:hypothetical protein
MKNKADLAYYEVHTNKINKMGAKSHETIPLKDKADTNLGNIYNTVETFKGTVPRKSV